MSTGYAGAHKWLASRWQSRDEVLDLLEKRLVKLRERDRGPYAHKLDDHAALEGLIDMLRGFDRGEIKVVRT